MPDTGARLTRMRVCIDDMLGPYDAQLDPTHRWNGWLVPQFTLDTVRQIAARTQELADEYGHESFDTIHVIDGGTHRGEPRVVVVHVRWQYHDDQPEHATEVVQPNAEDLHPIGGCEWTWYEAAPAPDTAAYTGDRP